MKIEINSPEIFQLGLNAIQNFFRDLAVDVLDKYAAYATDIDAAGLNVVMLEEIEMLQLSDIEIIETFFNEHAVPWSWLLFNSQTSSGPLEKFQFKITETIPEMYLHLSDAIALPKNTDIKIEKIEVPAALSEWIIPVAAAFGSTDQGSKFKDINQKLMRSGIDMSHFIIRENDHPVAAGTLYINNDSCMLHNIATHPNFRGKGYGSAITDHLIKEAIKANCKHCFLSASSDGFKIYQQRGFKIYGVTRSLVRI